jgi:hypothetical protein
MLLGNHWPTGIFPVLRSLVYARHQGPLAGVEITTFGLQDTTGTVRPWDELCQHGYVEQSSIPLHYMRRVCWWSDDIQCNVRTQHTICELYTVHHLDINQNFHRFDYYTYQVLCVYGDRHSFSWLDHYQHYAIIHSYITSVLSQFDLHQKQYVKESFERVINTTEVTHDS